MDKVDKVNIKQDAMLTASSDSPVNTVVVHKKVVSNNQMGEKKVKVKSKVPVQTGDMEVFNMLKEKRVKYERELEITEKQMVELQNKIKLYREELKRIDAYMKAH